jgi:uncharacterized membrane protein HdeD (DUF308 family)
MTARKRWQDYATMVFGILLFISPFVFGATSERSAAVSMYVLGGLLFVSGLVAAATGAARRSLLLNAPGLVSVLTFISPWVLRFTDVPKIAWTAWVLAALTVLVAGTLRAGRTRAKIA